MSQHCASILTHNTPLGKTTSQSSDYFDDDPEFAEALATLDESVLFGSQPLTCIDNVPNEISDSDGAAELKPPSQGRKRKRSPTPAPGQENSQEDTSAASSKLARHNSTIVSTAPSFDVKSPPSTVGPGTSARSQDTYDASKFGRVTDYMRRKRAKLQNQNADLSFQDHCPSQTLIFKSLAIYITGRTNPSLQVLRSLILQHGGEFHAYLDRKEMITHVITSNLTPAKALEFKNMKVVRPEWLLDSVTANKLLLWSDYKWSAHTLNSPTQMSAPGTPMLRPSARPSAISPGTPNVVAAAFVPPPKQPLSNATRSSSPPQVGAQSGKAIETLAFQPPEVVETGSPLVSSEPTRPSSSFATLAPAPAESSRAAYAIHAANPAAERLMESAEWREAHTSASGEAFIQGYYQNSRLHHLSKWKSELRSLVAKAQEDAEAQFSLGGSTNGFNAMSMDSRRKDKGKGRSSEKVIMHCDFDSFFVAAGLVTRPELKDKPVVVCHASGKGVAHSTSEIASASYAARAFGVKNGMSLGQARKLCSEIQTIPYEFEHYKELSLKFYTILMSISDDLQAVSVDEALIDVSSAVESIRARAAATGQMQAESYEIRMAENIRDRVRADTGCEVSIGVGPNIMLARLATKCAKPTGSFYLSAEAAFAHIAELDIVNLHGFAGAVQDKALASFGTSKLGDLAKQSKSALQRALGDKSGERIWNAIRGIDDRPLESHKPRKSVSADVNYGIRFENNENAEKFIYGLAREVSDRLRRINKRGKSLTLKIMKRHPDAPKEAPKFMGHGRCETFNKTCSISGIRGAATDDPDVIGREAWKLLQSMRLDPTELRGIGIQIQKFEVPEKSFASGVTAHGQLVKRFQQAVAAINAEKQQVPIHLNRVTPMQPANALVIPAEPSHNGGHKTVPGCKEVPYDLTGPTQADPKSNACSNTGARQFVPPLLHPITKSPEVASPANNFHDRHLNSAKPGTTPIPDVTVIDVDALDDKYIPAPAPGNKDSPFDLTMLSQLDQAAVTELVIIGNDRARSLSAPRLDRPGTNAKAGSLSPRRAQGRKRLTNMGPPTVIPDPSRYFPIFKRQFAPIPDQELVALDIDPMVYARMTKDQQKALISARRAAKGLDGAGRPIRQRKRQKKEDDNKPVYQVILAGKTELPTLRTATPGAPAVTETTDIQDMIRAWVETKVAKKLGPDPREVAHFGGFLERSMASDQGMQRTVEVMKWWRHVCMNNWGQEQEKRGQYGREWWVAWWDVKDKLDLIVKKRFGGKLNLD